MNKKTKRMNLSVWNAMLLCALAGTASATEKPEFDMSVTGRIEIGPDGQVIKYTVDDRSIRGQVKELVARSVANWRFEPIIDHGRAVIGVTRMTLALKAIPEGDDYLVRVDDISFGTSAPLNLTPPRYPEDLARQGVSGEVVLILHVDENGRVTQSHAERTDLGSAGTRVQMEKWRQRFEQVALGCAKDWRFPPIELIDGKPVATDVRIPINFMNDDNPWQARYRGELTPAPWRAEHQQLARNDDPMVAGPTSLDSHFKLISDVVGKNL